MARHKVFISYHHSARAGWNEKSDSDYRDELENLLSQQFGVIVSKSVQDGDISEYSSAENTHRIIREKYLSDSTVTVVLIGNDTWGRKHVDWELSSSLRKTRTNSRSGVIGIILPTFRHKENYSFSNYGKIKLENSSSYVDENYILERLSMNIDNGFVKLYEWEGSPYTIERWIDEAFDRRDKINPDNSLEMFKRNKS